MNTYFTTLFPRIIDLFLFIVEIGVIMWYKDTLRSNTADKWNQFFVFQWTEHT
jgi:hypothetical protein